MEYYPFFAHLKIAIHTTFSIYIAFDMILVHF